MVRENQSLMNNIQLFQKNTEELLNENNALKDSLDRFEVSYADLDLILQQKQTENSQLKTEVQRVKRNRTISRERNSPERYNDSPEKDMRKSFSVLKIRPELTNVLDTPERYATKEVRPSLPQTFNIPEIKNFKNQGTRSLYEQFLAKNQNKPQHDQRESRFSYVQPEKEIVHRTELNGNYSHQSPEREVFEYMTPEKDRRPVKDLHTNSKSHLYKTLVSYNPLQMDYQQASPSTFDRIWGQKMKNAALKQRLNHTVDYITPQKQPNQEGIAL